MQKETGADFIGRGFRPDRKIGDEQGKWDFLNADDPRKLLVFMTSSASTIRKCHDL
jgi:hypothetical protein